MRQARAAIYSQPGIPTDVKHSAWALFRHELTRTDPATGQPYTARRALANILRWLAGQRARLIYLQLSPREREAVGLLVEGLTHKQIALEMRCSERTVREHLIHVRRKVGTYSNLRVAYLAGAWGWVRPKGDT